MEPAWDGLLPALYHFLCEYLGPEAWWKPQSLGRDSTIINSPVSTWEYFGQVFLISFQLTTPHPTTIFFFPANFLGGLQGRIYIVFPYIFCLILISSLTSTFLKAIKILISASKILTHIPGVMLQHGFVAREKKTWEGEVFPPNSLPMTSPVAFDQLLRTWFVLLIIG